MRPLYLSLAGFGPHKEQVEFDLERLGSEGLFLLSGATGSGKTTFFDGICYALFREAAGEHRSEANLRCENVDPSVVMKVEYRFSLGDIQYKVEREFRPENLEEEIVEVGLSALSKKVPDGQWEVVEKTGAKNKRVTYVDNEIERLLQVKKKQFSQIVMIAQGEFQKVLLTPTKERKKVYKTIFQTEKYEELMKALAERRKALLAQEKELNLESKHARELVKTYDFDLESHRILGDKLRGEGAMDVLDVEEALEALISAHVDEEKLVKAHFDEMLKKFNENEKEIVKITGHEKLLSEISSVKLQLEKQREAVEKTSLERERIRDYPEKVANAHNLLGQWKEKKNICVDIAQKEKDLLIPKKQVVECEKLLLTLAEKKEKIAQSLAKNQLFLDEHKGLDVGLSKMEREVEDLETRFLELQNLEKELKKINEQGLKLEKEEGKHQKATELWVEVKKRHTEEQLCYFQEQAGILAEKLVDGEPCMVCGGLEPRVAAKVSGNVLSKEELEALKVEEDSAFEKMGAAKNDLDRCKEVYLQGKTATETLGERLLQTAVLEDIPAKLQEVSQSLQLNEKKIQLKELKVLQGKLVQAEKDRVAEERDLLGVEDSMTQKNLDLEKGKTQVLEQEKQILDMKQQVSGATVESVELEMNGCLKEIQEKENEIASVEEQYHTALRVETELKTKQVTLEEQKVEDLPEDFLVWKGKYQEENGVIFKEKELVLEKLNLLSTGIQTNRDVLVRVKKNQVELLTVEKKLKLVKPLADVANGENAVNITKLDTFVQMKYFDEALVEANLIYHQMNQEKYSMLRGDDSAGRSEIGLEVYVEERGTGVKRPASTLSGGEAFQASLALALGFSTTVQRSSTAVQMESLFLDEGFGSLDPESLNFAIDTLTEMAGNGRLVGVISHVESMKNAIEKKILFYKENQNTRVEMEF